MERFDLSQKLNQKSVIGRVKSIYNGFIPEPVVIDFDCSTCCNLDCYFCISKDIVGYNAFTRDDLISWSQVIKEMNVKAVILTGGGEPLTNPYIDDFIISLKKNIPDIQIGLVTNGTLINRHESLNLCNWMRVSLDAGVARTFAIMKGKDCFDTILNNLSDFNRHKGECETGVSFLISYDTVKGISNIEEIYIAAKLSKEIKCDYFELKLQFNMNHFDIRLDQEKINAIKCQITELSGLQNENFHIYLNHNISSLISDRKKEQKYDMKCHICNLRTIVSPRGLYVCSYHRGNERFKYGESDPKLFEKYWNSKERQNLIKSIVLVEDCVFNCARKQSNSKVQKILDELNQGMFCAKEIEDTDLFI